MNAGTYASMQVVVIDDDAGFVRALVGALKDLGCTVRAFERSRDGLEWALNRGADIVICDAGVSDPDGFEILRRLKAAEGGCAVILVTAQGELDVALRALREGATDSFEKPLDAAVLRAAIERTARFRRLVQQERLLTDEVAVLSRELSYKTSGRNVMVGESAAMKRVAQEILDYAGTTATVLICGESGTGKEVIAHAIHESSPRREKPILTLNCSSVSENLFESEMFGHRRGAFTGAVETRGGYVEAARGGTIFLDEIGDLPLSSQAKILRLLEQKTYLPVGESRERVADIRIVAATNRQLQELVAKEQFREDLYYRLRVCTIDVPPLRERREDIPLLALYFVLQFAAEMNRPIEGIDDDALPVLCGYDFPGNVRELRNVIESSIIRCKHGGLLRRQDLPALAGAPPADQRSESWPLDTLKLEEVERRLYQEALRQAGNNVSAAARLAGLDRSRFRRRLKALGLASE